MFGLFGRRVAPADPVTFLNEITIASPPEEVFALIDVSDPRYRQTGMGHELIELGKDDYLLTLVFAPDEPLRVKIGERRSPQFYATRTILAPSMGTLDVVEEEYTLSRTADGGTRVSVTTKATFYAGISWSRYGKELCFVSVACLNELRKLKLHAERGAEAARAVMRENDTAKLDRLLAEAL